MKKLTLTLACACGCTHPASNPWVDLRRPCSPDAPAVSVPAAARDSLPRYAHRSHTMDDDLADLAREVPGGYGSFVLQGTIPVLSLVDTTQLAAVAAALLARGVFTERQARKARVRRARWDFAQLHEWFRYFVLHGIEEDSGLVSSDIDEGENRITYGVLDETARKRLERRLARLNLPCFLVTIEVTGPFEPLCLSR